MNRFGLNMGRNSRGSSRGIPNSHAMKSSLPNYGFSAKKDTNYYDSKINKNSQLPASSIASTKPSVFKQPYNYHQYDYLLDKQVRDTEKEKIISNYDEKKDKNKDFRIRANKEKESLKGGKEDEERQKSMLDSLRKLDEQKMDKEKGQKQRMPEIQKTKDEGKKNSENEVYSSKLTSTTTSSKYSSKTIGLVGLSNLGNTCFMNSILQCLFNLPEFNEYFLNDEYAKEVRSGGKVAQAYAKTVKMMRSSSSRAQTPSELKTAVGSKKSRFLGYSQQDAQQFLAALLELLSQDLNRSSKPKYRELTADTSKNSLKQISKQWWNYNKQREDSVVCDYFSGQMISKVVCSRCKHESIAFDNMWDLALGFNGSDGGKINKMISNFLKEEVIADDYYCSKCKCFRECRRKVDFYRLPKILVFQLKRFSFGRWRKVKLNNYVKVQSRLDLSSLITESNDPSVENPVYNLVGMVNHSGDIDFGHYTAECKNPINGKWYNFNDSHVNESRVRESFESSSPYLLFYAKEN